MGMSAAGSSERAIRTRGTRGAALGAILPYVGAGGVEDHDAVIAISVRDVNVSSFAGLRIRLGIDRYVRRLIQECVAAVIVRGLAAC